MNRKQQVFLSIASNENLYLKLKKSLFLKRFNDLLKSTKTDELTLDDITKEVESVRKNRYDKGKQIA